MTHEFNLPDPNKPRNGETGTDSGADASAGGGKPTDRVPEPAPIEPPPPPGIPDPKSALDAYQSAPASEARAKPPPRVTALAIRKPKDQEYIRVMPATERILPLFKSTSEGDKLYLFRPDVEPFLPPKSIRSYRLVLAKAVRAVTPFLWPLPVPQDDAGTTWHESADQIARDAETQWMKVVADMAGGCYVGYPASADLPEPEWPAERFDDLILLAFRHQRIDSPDSPIIRRLNGDII